MEPKKHQLPAGQTAQHSQKPAGANLKRVVLALVIAILVVVLIGIAGVVAMPLMVRQRVQEQLDSIVTRHATVSSETLMSTLEASSELVTSKMTMTGCVEYDDEGVPVLTKGDFVMIYKATVKAGVDVRAIQFAIDDSESVIYIYVPDAEVLDVNVLTDSIKYYKTMVAPFNLDATEDLLKAQKQAEQDAEKEALDTGILEVADSQSETLVRGILESVTDGYQMKFLRTLESIRKKQTELAAKATLDES